MSPNDAHFDQFRLPSSNSNIIASRGTENDVSGFSLLHVEEDFIRKLKTMNVLKPADIQVYSESFCFLC